MEEIKKIADIIESAIPKLEEIKKDFTDKILIKQAELENLNDSSKSKSAEIYKLKETEHGIRANIKHLESNIENLENRKNSIKIDEEKEVKIKKDISSSEEELSKVIASRELARIEKEEVEIITRDIKEEILSLNKEKLDKINSIAQLKKDLSDTNHKYKYSEENLKRIVIEQKSEEEKLSLTSEKLLSEQGKIEEKGIEFLKLSEELLKLSSVYKDKESDIKKLEKRVIDINSERDALEEENEQKVKKIRNEENRLLAIKKEVLKFILEYKDAGNKAQIAKFAQRVENDS